MRRIAPIVGGALVGRAGEVERVVEMVRNVAAGQAATMLVSGEAGVGKTALVGEACSQVADMVDVRARAHLLIAFLLRRRSRGDCRADTSFLYVSVVSGR